jgi:site-specific DNA-methyltransferase (adenine-specific)
VSTNDVWSIACGDGPSTLLAYGDVDHVIVDVPYSARVDAGNEADKTRDNPFAFAPMTDDLRERTAQAIAARCRRWAVVFTSDDEQHLWRDALVRRGMEFIRFGIWVRLGSKPQMTGDRPGQGHEVAVIAHAGGVTKRWNGGGRPAIWHAPLVRGDERVHPTQKPSELLKQIIEDFTDEGDLIADPFGGSFSTGVVAVSLGRRFFGVDLDEKWVALGRERIKLPLFDAKPLQADLFTPSNGSIASRAREEIDRQILRLRKAGLVRRDGNTNKSKYFRAVPMQGGASQSTGDTQ